MVDNNYSSPAPPGTTAPILPKTANAFETIITTIVNSLFNNEHFPNGEEIATRIAVWVFFLLVIGIARLMWESRN